MPYIPQAIEDVTLSVSQATFTLLRCSCGGPRRLMLSVIHSLRKESHMAVTVRVFTSSGKPASGKRVSVSFDGFSRGMASGSTDSNGRCTFDNDPGNGKVYVDGKEVFKGRLSGEVPIHL